MWWKGKIQSQRTLKVTLHLFFKVYVYVWTSPYIEQAALWLITFSYAHCVPKPMLVNPVLSSVPPLGDGCHCCHCHSWPAQQQHRLSAACSMQICQQIFRAPVILWICECVCLCLPLPTSVLSLCNAWKMKSAAFGLSVAQSFHVLMRGV